MNIESLIFLIPLPPLLAFAVIIFLPGQRRALSHWLAVSAVVLSWLASMAVFVAAITRPDLAKQPLAVSVNWLPMGDQVFKTGVMIDPLSAVVLFFVAWTIVMIFIYSIAYHNYGAPAGKDDKPGLPPMGAEVQQHGHAAHRVPSVEPLYTRFFAFASLFAFGMLALVVTDNLLVLYMAWEIMGLCSYLLIGFWFARQSARDAAIKAFLTTRIGDMFMLLGLAALYSLTGTLNYQAILSNPAVLEKLSQSISPLAGLSWSALIGLLIFAGTVGKSAQFPLHVWLPDAMEGPTPVSAMIHAATMVSAGVYLVIRFYPLLAAGLHEGSGLTTPMLAMASVGAFTALFAASIALAQSDVKRVLAYSTISQLGFMIAALGVGAYVAAVFHLVMHAFFKALLFLGSGSVIHGVQHGALHTNDDIDPQNMFNMGGLINKMPKTAFAFIAGGLSLAGFPYITAGFWSKDEILAGAFGGGYMTVFVVLALAAFLTAFYTMR
ncbi:MAG: NADH-quinone oxidoreductase subunit L, partial [Anaerolineae bacterium]|nr:NADH-quinone oxidoreductase subunit L [Anaerolineae bacterium]